MARWRVLTGALVALVAFSPYAAAEAGEAVHPGDTLDLRVATWDPVTRELATLEWLTSSFAVDRTGVLTLPIAGTVPAGGQTVDELQREVGDRLRTALGVRDGLHVSLRVLEHGPLYVIGAVEKPGAYEFRPGLSTVQAIALAGGIRRANTLFSRTERDAVRALGDHRLANVERWRTIARIARLEAEASEQDAITPPESLADVAMADELLAVEAEILNARQDDHREALAAIAELKTLLGARIDKLQQEIALRDRLIARTREEESAVDDLVERGLARTSRVNTVRRESATQMARKLELETATLEARQQIAEADRDRAELIGDRRVTIVTELRDARTELSRIEVQLETAGALFSEAARFGATVERLSKENAAAEEPSFLITRPAEGGARIIEASAATPVEPGDVIEVRAPQVDDVPSLVGLPPGTAALGAPTN